MPDRIIIDIERMTPLDKMVPQEALSGALYGGENLAHRFIISATRNKAPLALSGIVTGTLVNWSLGLTQPLSGEIVDGKAVVLLPASCYAHTGRATITIFLTDENTIAIYSCSANIIPTETEDIIDPEDIINIASIQAAAIRAEEAATAASAAAEAASNITGAIAPTESTSTATLTYQAGSYFFYDGKFYRATDDIASGDTIIPSPATGYNCIEKTVGEELMAAIAAASQVAEGAIRYDVAQALTPAQKAQARENIGVSDISGVVKYDTPQSLTDNQKAQARTNIGAASASDLSDLGTAISELQAEIEGIGNVVADVVKTNTGIRIDYTDGTSKSITIEAGGTQIDDVVYDEDHYLHFYDENGEDLFDPVYIEGGGGGGGGGSGSASITRVTPAAVDCIYGDTMPIQFTFTATDSGGDPVGSGVGTWSIGGVIVARNVSVAQGSNTFDIGPYLTTGANSVKLSVSVDTGGDANLTATKTWTVNAVNMYFLWPYDDTQINTAGFTDRWTPYGDIAKTTHTRLDGVELETSTTTRSGVQQSMSIPMQTHGAHGVERWLTATINGASQNTASQYHEMIFVVSGNMTPIVAISLQNKTINQYDTIQIPVVVYDPSSVLTDATLYVDGAEVGVWTDIDRSQRFWSYTPTTAGAHILTVECGSVSKSVTITANAVDIDVEEVSGYSFRFKASDIATNEAARNWSSNGVNATYSNNFDWINGGLHTESDDSGALQQYFCIKAGTRMTINHKLFANDPKPNGMNFKIIFKVKNVRDYEAQIAHCYADGIGVRMYAHESLFTSSGMSVSVPYGEDEYIELEFDVYPAPRQENDGNYRYMMAWIDGVITSCRVYGASDSFVQPVLSQEGIVLGSDDCDLYIYMVKAYPMLVTRDNHIDNFIMDAPNASEMVRRYNRNDILDESGMISYEKLMQKNPDCRVWLYDIPYLTNGKKDKVKNCQFHQFWPNGSQYYTLSGVGTMTVQGTSSVKYIQGAANTDISFASVEDGNGNDLMANGTEDETYGNNWYVEDENNPGHAKVYTASEARTAAGITDESEALGPEWVVVTRDANRTPTHYIKALGIKITDTSCPITYSNTKVNFASCEQVNNMCNAIWYQRFNPYPSLTAHDCMEFVMGVQFIKDSGEIPDENHFVLWGDNKYHMYSIANMGNSKKNVHVFHDLSNPNECCVEINDNNAEQMRMVNDDLSAEDWSGDVYFGMRYPDTKNPSQAIRNAWQRLVTWMATNNPNAATGDALDTPETYGNYTFRGHDRAGLQVLRGTVVKRYAGTYTHDTFNRRMAKMLSECEDYLVMDSFIYHFVYLERHTMVDNVSKNTFWSSTDLLHWDLSKAYDMDTSDGNNNQGQMVFDYGNEYNDDIGGMKVFNAADSVWFVFCANLYEACQAMFTNREAAGAWSSTAYHNFLLEQQQKVPERCWVECYWYDYLRTYEQGISAEWMTFLDGGQKTHQRKHYEFFEELYDASKYRGTAATSQNVNFRAYTPNEWAGVPPRSELTITMYNKMYISMDVGTTVLDPIKVERGAPYTIDFSSAGMLNNTLIAINTAPMIQAISGMEQLYPDTCVFSAATRLRELTIGSTATGYQNTFLRTLALDNNTMLEYLYVQNLPNANSVLDLSHCSSLLEVDATGSGFTGYEFAVGGLLTEAILHRPTSLNMRNLSNLTDAHFTITDMSALAIIRHENTPGVDSLALVNAAVALQIVRLIGIDWTLSNTDVLDRMYNMQGLDENNYTISRSILSGEAYVPVMRQRNLDLYNAAWPNLDVSYDSMTEQYAVRFYNDDGTTIKDLYGNDFVEYIDRGSLAYDPVQAGEVLTPTKASDAQYVYTFSGWQNLSGAILTNRNVTALYSTETRTYTVRWFSQVGTMLKQMTNVAYGSCVQYNSENIYDFPTLSDEEDQYIYKCFMGWDKSTGFITGDTDVYAIWDRAALPEAGAVNLKDMTMGQIAGIAKNKLCDTFFEAYDHIDIQVGRDYSFSNVPSQTLVASPRYFDGTEANVITTNIRLFDADAPSFTLAIDYEFYGSDANNCLLACFDEDGNEGFRLRYSSHPNIQWGDTNLNVGNTFMRGILTLRHQKGSHILYVGYNNVGNGIYNGQATEATVVRTRTTTTNAMLTIGGITFADNTHDYMAQGWVYWCKIWFDDLGAPDTKAMATWPHETWRVHYDTLHKRLKGNTAERAAGEFIFNAPLEYQKRMNPTSTNVGGWDQSELRPFINGQVFDALPVCWQSLIQTVKINASAGDKSTEIVVSEDRMYLMALGDCFNTTDATYQAEADTRIPFFVANKDRIKFPGFILDDDVDIITDANDPTLYPDNTVQHGKTVWINTSRSSYGYIYASPEFCAKHKWASGRLMTSTDNLDVAGAQGGKWLLSRYWWLRSPYLGYSSYFNLVNYGGSSYTNTANYSYALVCGFSI